jgi:hypothetical protein
MHMCTWKMMSDLILKLKVTFGQHGLDEKSTHRVGNPYDGSCAKTSLC